MRMVVRMARLVAMLNCDGEDPPEPEGEAKVDWLAWVRRESHGEDTSGDLAVMEQIGEGSLRLDCLAACHAQEAGFCCEKTRMLGVPVEEAVCDVEDLTKHQCRKVS